jgi:hypothetical protein
MRTKTAEVDAVPALASLHVGAGPGCLKHVDVLRLAASDARHGADIDGASSFQVPIDPGNLDASFVPAEEAAFNHFVVGEHCLSPLSL